MKIPACAALLCLALVSAHAADRDALKAQVMAAERAFAKTMADRDLAAFEKYVADDTVFFTSTTALRGRAAVVEFWKRFYADKQAPFSWEPDQVEVLDGGTLAHSSGPVYAPDGKQFSRFNSVWRQESPGVWKVIFDRGEPLPCKKD